MLESLLWKCIKWDHSVGLKKSSAWEDIKQSSRGVSLSKRECFWESSNEHNRQTQEKAMCARCSAWCWMEGSWSFLNLKGNVKHTANLLFGLMSKTELWKGLYG